ncbi:hypothetical protein SDC9_146017 [bioreactor metagenome]|uniref:Uncharacterized protein n=1 Tax=bioreactor metagenome TaxID=1076179 RepID=A0A645EA52_9ZZZZ
MPASGVPPVATSYQLKTGLGAPDVEVTEQVGTATPHCVELLAVGVEGRGLVVTETVLETTGQPEITAVPV